MIPTMLHPQEFPCILPFFLSYIITWPAYYKHRPFHNISLGVMICILIISNIVFYQPKLSRFYDKHDKGNSTVILAAISGSYYHIMLRKVSISYDKPIIVDSLVFIPEQFLFRFIVIQFWKIINVIIWYLNLRNIWYPEDQFQERVKKCIFDRKEWN